MAFWAVVVPVDRYENERLYHHETLDAPRELTDGGPGPADGDEVLLVAATDPPVVFGVARAGAGRLAYTRRGLDEPQPVVGLALDGVLTRVDEATFRAHAGRLAPAPDRRDWLVSVDLPIEAGSPAEAVREFWTYVMRLGPHELPAFVSPAGDELAMQAYVLSEPVNLDPEEDD